MKAEIGYYATNRDLSYLRAHREAEADSLPDFPGTPPPAAADPSLSDGGMVPAPCSGAGSLERAPCDCCGKRPGVRTVMAYGIETNVCGPCGGDEDEQEAA